MEATRAVRAALAMVLAGVCVVAFIAISESKRSSDGQHVELIADCAVDPSAPGCSRPSFLDMINGINNRAQGNAIRQKKVREELLKQENRRALHEEAVAKQKAAKKNSADDLSTKDLTSTKYNGLDIASKDAVDGTMKRLLQKGGKAAVEAKVAEIREQILADSGKLFHYGKKAGYLPPPEALKKFK